MSDATPNAPSEAEIDYDKVICPGCVHQFRAIPVNVQKELTHYRVALSEIFAKCNDDHLSNAKAIRWISERCQALQEQSE